MLYPNRRDGDQAIRANPSAEPRTLKELRAELAAARGAAIACPVTARSVVMAAGAVREAHEGGTPLAGVAPVWRVPDETSSLPRRLPLDPSFVLDQCAWEASAAPGEGYRHVPQYQAPVQLRAARERG